MRDQLTMRVLTILLVLAALSACGRDEATLPAPSKSGDTPAAATTTEPVPDASAVPAPDFSAPAPNEQSPDEYSTSDPAPAPESEPEPAPLSEASIADTLQRADQAMQDGRIEQGEDNALALYRSVLVSDPTNGASRAGIDGIVTNLSERIEITLSERRYHDASPLLSVLLKLRPDDAVVTALAVRVDAGRETDALLAEAQRLMDAGQWLEPADDNAAAVYGDVLQRDAAHPLALAGLARLESAVVAQATAAAEAGDYARSDKLLADAARLRPDSGSVQDASTQIVELRQDRAGELLQQAHAAAGSGDVARAEQLLGQLEQVSAQSQGIEELRARIELARLYGAFAPGQKVADTLMSGGTGPELVVIPIGNFEMGSPRGEADRKQHEGPQHVVNLKRGIGLGRTEITVAQFRIFVRASGYVTSAQQAGHSTIYDERIGSMRERDGVDWQQNHGGHQAEANLPVVHVSWNDAKAYTDWLARETGKSYRLPSEAEFEYVQRAGSSARYPWGDANPGRIVANLTGDLDRSVSRRVWSNGFPDYADGYWGAAPVRTYPPNRYGVHDSDGNVSEWVEDCWHDNYARAPADGSAWVNPGCIKRVIRGASWASAPDQARAAFRISATPDTTNARVGFRVARDL